MEKKKYSIRKSLVAFGLLFATMFAFLFTYFGNTIGFTKTVVSADVETVETAGEENNEDFEVLDYVDISQEGYVFSSSDFSNDYNSTITNYALFTNRTVSITCTMQTDENNRFSININSKTTPEQLAEYVYTNPTTGKVSYVLDLNGKTDDVENYVYISITKYYPRTSTNPTAYSRTFDLKFFVIQTPINFEKENSDTTKKFISWNYTYYGVQIDATAPTNGETYSTLNLTFPSGTRLNPVFVKFIYCGETYTVYRYSYEDNGETITKTFNAATDQEITIDKLEFSKSGTYDVYIYDKTIENNCPNKNYFEYNFIIKNPTNSFYMSAHHEDGTIIMNEQITNESVIIDFVNFRDIKDQVNEIKVTRSYHPTLSQNISEEKYYSANELPAFLEFTLDGTYNIEIRNRRGISIYDIEFIILKSIRSSFEIDGVSYRINADEPSNATKEFDIVRTVYTTYNDILAGKTSYTFNLIVARSAPNITGVNNNARTQDSVNLRVYGVGNIQVYATLEGNQMMLGKDEYTNGEKLPTFTEQGKYFIKITDEMGSVTTKSFTITVKLNTASIILISLASAFVVFLIVFIIISRGKVKVR